LFRGVVSPANIMTLMSHLLQFSGYLGPTVVLKLNNRLAGFARIIYRMGMLVYIVCSFGDL
ncbi:hypothetical protein, partial [Pseudoalteromonas sp. S1610]|uniref:hypothetical protein n=1 Tax=Pseudoalteromonas sp. S1610 TaxID=579506 RepID=UPI001BB163E3